MLWRLTRALLNPLIFSRISSAIMSVPAQSALMVRGMSMHFVRLE